MMAEKDLKRGPEKVNLETEKELSAKQLKLSEDLKSGEDEDNSDFEDLSGEFAEQSVSAVPGPSEMVLEASRNLDALVMSTSGSEVRVAVIPLSPTTGNGAEAARSGGDEDYELPDPPMSDDWTAVMWKNNTSNIQVVTKSSYSCEWIKEVLESNIFGYRSDGKALKLEICRNENNKYSISSCSSSVFCFTNDKWDSKLLEVKDLSTHLEMKNVIILLSEKTPDNQLPGQMKDQGDFPVLNLAKHQVTWYENNLKFYNRKIEEMERLVKGSAPRKGHKIGIFSRSSESDFDWLKMELESGCFRDAVKDVRPYYISNRGFQQFVTDVSNSTFGILYHTKNHGRINITDVTDSLYDEELQYMSLMLEKKVIVVVDDLQNGNDEEKSRIRNNQPTIGKTALDLFLFTTDEKKFLEPLVQMRNLINGESK